MRFVLALAALCGLFCFSLSSLALEINLKINRAEIKIENNVLWFKGPIQDGDLTRIKKLIKPNKKLPNLLIVNSGGGSIEEGLKLGMWIYNNGLDVEVKELCASSCANYIFPAGKNKYLYFDSMLIWHGGMQQPGFKKQYISAGRLEDWQKLVKKERTFFNTVGVNSYLTVCGQYSEFNKSLENLDGNLTFKGIIYLILGKLHVGYDYGLQSMQMFGINNIVLLDGSWDWRKHVNQERNRLVRRFTLSTNDNGKYTCI